VAVAAKAAAAAAALAQGRPLAAWALPLRLWLCHCNGKQRWRLLWRRIGAAAQRPAA
jgi:hypothetical protein